MKSVHHLRRVTGIEYRLISILVMVNLWWVGTLAYKNPVKSFNSVKTLFRNFAKMIGRKNYVRAFKVSGKYVWDIFSPGWPSKGFNSFFVNQLHEIDPISERYTALRRLFIAITKRCPLQCEHCSESATLYQNDVLSYEQLRSKIETFVQRGVGQLVYSGGEPLSRFDDLTKLVSYFDDRCDQWIYTSGYGLTSQKANALKRVGLDGVAISLDHHLGEHHNHFRGNSKSFFWVLEAIKNCQKAGIMVALNLCPTRDYLDHFGLEHYLQLANDLHVPIVNILEPRAVGNYQGRNVELDRSHKDNLLRITHKYNFDKTLVDFPTIVFPAAFRKTLPCGGGRSYLFLDYDGKLYPCPFCKIQVSDVSLSRNACLA